MRDPYDAKRDAESEARYESDPRAEPEQREIDEAREKPGDRFILDESAGFRHG
jgi:hypothetical protein